VTGRVRLKLYKGNIIIAGRWSPFALYDHALASFDESGGYDQADAAGFIKLFSLPTRSEAQQRQRVAAADAELKGALEQAEQDWSGPLPADLEFPVHV
jgi:hypothetical protein